MSIEAIGPVSALQQQIEAIPQIVVLLEGTSDSALRMTATFKKSTHKGKRVVSMLLIDDYAQTEFLFRKHLMAFECYGVMALDQFHPAKWNVPVTWNNSLHRGLKQAK